MILSHKDIAAMQVEFDAICADLGNNVDRDYRGDFATLIARLDANTYPDTKRRAAILRADIEEVISDLV